MSDDPGATASGHDVFAAVIGQPDAVALLRSAARAPVHAYLFLGPRGSAPGLRSARSYPGTTWL